MWFFLSRRQAVSRITMTWAYAVSLMSCLMVLAIDAAKAADAPQAGKLDASGKVLYSLDFSGKEKKNATDWLRDNGFKLQKDAKDPDYIAFSFNATSIVIEAKQQAFGFAMGETPLVPAKKIRITWGVSIYPKGASWEKGVNREALMVYAFYGKEKVDSGSIFLPNSPYYVGLFLSDTDKRDKVYEGRSYKTCARYVCLGNPKPGETVTSEFDLATAFQSMYAKDKVPPVSAISLEVDTGGTPEGYCKAFVSRIELLE